MPKTKPVTDGRASLNAERYKTQNRLRVNPLWLADGLNVARGTPRDRKTVGLAGIDGNHVDIGGNHARTSKQPIF